MIPCIPEHIGEAQCPECGENHKEYGALPERALSPTDLHSMLELDSVDGLIPVFTVHGEDEDGYYMQIIPALVVVSDTVVRVVWFNPTTDTGWVMLRTERDIDRPFALAKSLGDYLYESAMLETEIEGMEVVHDDSPPRSVV